MPQPAHPPERDQGVRSIEIGCDESGAEGENLLDGVTAVFAHASVSLSPDTATAIVGEVRDRIGSPAVEYKANHLLRTRSRAVLEWLLEPGGPLHDHARVFLVEKAFFGLGRLVAVLRSPSSPAPSPDTPEGDLDRAENGPDPASLELARLLYTDGPRAYGEHRWWEFLRAGNALLRTRSPDDATDPTAEFFELVRELLERASRPDGAAPRVLGMLVEDPERARAYRRRRARDPGAAPTLDPLIPAIVRSIRWWSADGGRVTVIHDQQRTLTAARITGLGRVFDRPSRDVFAGLRLVDSRSDPRVQLADFLAGVARRIAEDRLGGDGDAALVELLRPHVDPHSIWGQAASWPAPGPPPGANRPS